MKTLKELIEEVTKCRTSVLFDVPEDLPPVAETLWAQAVAQLEVARHTLELANYARMRGE